MEVEHPGGETEGNEIEVGVLEIVSGLVGSNIRPSMLEGNSIYTTNLNDLGIDSLSIVNLTLGIEEKYDIKILDSDFDKHFVDIRSIARLVEGKLGDQKAAAE